MSEQDISFIEAAAYNASSPVHHELTKFEKEIGFNEADVPHIQNLFKKYIDGYVDVFCNVWSDSERLDMSLQTAWINFQQKHEFRPPHIHSNCDASFVLYLDMPAEIKEEKTNLSADFQPGNVVFTYNDTKIDHPLAPTNQFTFIPERGDLYIFPYYLNHFSMPFKSDVTRISVSGNIVRTD